MAPEHGRCCKAGAEGRETPTPDAAPSEHQIRTWTDWAERYLPGNLGDLLDFGCGKGDFLGRVQGRCASAIGVDIDEECVARAAERVPEARLILIRPDTRLPFGDRTFDTVSALEVIEHVSRERFLLDELARVTKPHGRLLLTTPHRGLLTFLDPGNLKFVAPALHRFIHVAVLRDKAYYERRFGAERRRRRMIANFAEQRCVWHRHYRLDEIRALAPPTLRVEAWGVYFPFYRAMSCCRLAVRVLTRGRRTQLPGSWQRKMAEFSRRRCCAGDQLVVLFRKHG